jgi:hypothetical protein
MKIGMISSMIVGDGITARLPGRGHDARMGLPPRGLAAQRAGPATRTRGRRHQSRSVR